MGVACSEAKCVGENGDRRLVAFRPKNASGFQAFYYDKYGNIKARNSTSYFGREVKDLEEIKKKGGVLNGIEYTFKSGAIYKGQWLNNMRHGFGCQTWPDGATYEGEWRENVAEGKGRFLHSDGDVFIGQWKANKANGLGSYYHQGRLTYAGEWENDLQHGHGVENLVEGARFQGAFREGQKDGHGLYFWRDGSTYSGEWSANFIDGHGVYLAADGRRFSGQWQESAIHGIGLYTWPGGREYGGRYVSDQKQGFGVFKWQDGRKYEGYWHAGKQEGRGRYTLKDGTAKLAMWREGKRVVGLNGGKAEAGPRPLFAKPTISDHSDDDKFVDGEADVKGVPDWKTGKQDGYSLYSLEDGTTKVAVPWTSPRSQSVVLPARRNGELFIGSRVSTPVPQRWISSPVSTSSGGCSPSSPASRMDRRFAGRFISDCRIALSTTTPRLQWAWAFQSNSFQPAKGGEATAEADVRLGADLVARLFSAQTLTPDATQARVCTVADAASEAARAEAAGRGKLPPMTVVARTREPEPEEQSGEVEELRRRLSEALRQNEALARRNLELERAGHARKEDVPCVPPPPPQQPPPTQQLLSAASRADISDPGASQPRLLAQSMTRITPSFTAAGPRSVPVLTVASAVDSENVSPRPTARVFRMAPAPAHSPREMAPRQASPARTTAARVRQAPAAPAPATATGMAEAWSGPRRFLSAPLAALEAAAAAAHPPATAIVTASAAAVVPAASGAARSLSPPAKVAVAAAAQGPRLSRTATATTGPRVSCQRTASPLVPKARDNCSSTVGLTSSLPSSLPSSAVLAPPTMPQAAAAVAAWGQVRVVSVGGHDPAQSCMAPPAAVWPAAAAAAAAPTHASHAYRRTGSLEAVPLAAPAPVMGTAPFNSASPKLAQRESTWPEAVALPTVGTSEANAIGATQPGQPLKLRMGGPSASSSQL